MKVIQGYELVERVDRNPVFTLYKGKHVAEQQPVLIKTLTKEFPSAEEIAATVHEFHITKDLAVKEVLRPYRMEKHSNVPVVIFELFEGVPLTSYLGKSSLDVIAFLQIAIRLTTALARIHQNHVIHKDIHPGNIIIQEQAYCVKLTGFGNATLLSKEDQHRLSPYVLEGTLPYISPEQTGRMNRSLDYRTDLYSLGVTFYEMLTGRLPFEASDPVEWVHAHIAKKPLTPEQLEPGIPSAVSNIVMKLLSKTPESRYQSAYGLQKDLEQCLSQWNRSGKIVPFSLAQEDKSGTFEMPQKLYGRKNETAALYRAFKRVSGGASELLLIPGASGIGKTALVGEVQKPLVTEKGYFISGKFDLLQRHVPFAALIQAFKRLLRQILTESEDRVSAWRQAILDEISPNGQVIVDSIPELKWLIGKQPEVQPLPAIEAQNRFQIVFQQFVRVFTKKEHPLVLFLDDLQWADAASLNLLRYLLTHTKSEYLLVIGAYRDNEVELTHPFTLTLDEIKQSGVKVSSIPLAALSYPEVVQWVADTLHAGIEQTKPLADAIFNITDGNPFFVSQLLQSLYRDRKITFHIESGTWHWQVDDLRHLAFTHDVVEFMVAKVQKLSPNVQQVLKMAACIGNQFDLSTLSIIYEKPAVDTAQHLWEALEEGLVVPLNPAYKWQYPDEIPGTADGHSPHYRFLHDRVQQAVYSMMSQDDQQRTHYRIGRLLWHNTDLKERDDLLFDIVNHLNIGRSRVVDAGERIRLAGLNQQAGQRAKQATAFEAALHYYKTGIELLSDEGWNEHNLMMLLMLGWGECEYLNSHFGEAEKIFDNILQNARSRTEKLYVYSLQITLYTHVGDYESAVRAGMQGLQLFGWNIPSNPSKLLLAAEIIKTRWQLGKRRPEDLALLPRMIDDNNHLLMQLLAILNSPAYFIDQNLVSLLMLRAFRFTLKHGHTDVSALTYSNYALFLSAGFGDLTQSYEFGRFALKMADESGLSDVKAVVYFIFGTFVNHWKNHIRGNLNYLDRSQQFSIEAGNLHQVAAASSFIIISTLIKGENITDTIAHIDKQLELATQIKSRLAKDFLTQVKQWLLCLNRPGSEPNLDNVRTPEDEASKLPYYTVLLQMAYLFDKPVLALRIMDELEQMADHTLVMVTAPEYYFYHSIWLAKFYPDANSREKRRYRKLMQRNRKKMKKWAKHCPKNYWHKLTLIDAEIARIEGDDREAAALYEQAIQSAEENEYQQNAAIAAECAAKYYLGKNMVTLAKTYMESAHRGYLKWGAVAKALMMEDQYPRILMTAMSTYTAAAEDETTPESLDFKTIVKASQTISGEIVLDKLLTRLMMILLESAGAEKGFLILQETDGLFIEAAGNINPHSVTGIESIPVSRSKQLSSNIVQYVFRTKEPVVLADAASEGMFTKDPYVMKKRPKSILCMPILYQGKPSGLLYMENNMTTHAFTPERLKVLIILSSQAAISIENARLYTNLEQKVQERTLELQQANRDLEQVNQELARTEQSRRRLLSNISHDLRTPITSIQGYVEAILDGIVETPEQQRHYLQRSHNRLKGLNRMIQDLFELSQLEAGQVSFEFELVPIDQLVRRCYDQYEFDVKKSGLNFELRLPQPGFPKTHLEKEPPVETEVRQQLYPLVEVDPGRIEQVFANLVSNAVKHTPEGGTIRVVVDFEHDRNDNAPTQVVIQIRDDGCGIAADDLPYVFDRFYSGSQSKGGHGLGLAICKEIIDFHKGRIWAESEPDQGSVFCFALPIYPV